MHRIQLLILMALVGSLGQPGSLAEEGPPPPPTRREDPAVLCARAERLVKDIQRISPQLQKIVADEKAEIHDRCDAALAIGALRDRDAIGVLVQHLAELNDSRFPETHVYSGGSTSFCALALGQIGPASVPPVVPIYLYRDGGITRACDDVLLRRTNHRFARGMIRGRIAKTPSDSKIRERAEIIFGSAPY